MNNISPPPPLAPVCSAMATITIMIGAPLSPNLAANLSPILCVLMTDKSQLDCNYPVSLDHDTRAGASRASVTAVTCPGVTLAPDSPVISPLPPGLRYHNVMLSPCHQTSVHRPDTRQHKYLEAGSSFSIYLYTNVPNYAKMSINICNRFLLFSTSIKTCSVLAIESINTLENTYFIFLATDDYLLHNHYYFIIKYLNPN